MTVEERIDRFAEYWCYHKLRRNEMALEMKIEMLRSAKEAFVAGMQFQQNGSNQDFDEIWLNLLSKDIENEL